MADQEGYRGVRFKTTIVGIEAPVDHRIKELEYWCAIFDRHDLAPPYKDGSYGNLSFRARDRRNANAFIITTARTGLGALTNKCFAKISGVDLKQGVVYACCVKEPSSESMVHYVVYRERPDVGAVFHGHSPEILVSANALEVPETEREAPYGTLALVEEVLNVLGKGNFLIMKNHGFLSLGKTMQEAGELAMRMHRQTVRALGVPATL